MRSHWDMSKTGRFRRLAAAARSLAGSGDGLHRCPECGRDFVCPVEWDTVGEEHWLIALRCGECGHWREELVTNERANDYDLTLDRQCSKISDALRRIDRERMEAELDVLIAALDRDLIDAADFAR
jgi:hypothetical protein